MSARTTPVDLAPQVRHVELDDVRVAAEVVVPHLVEDEGLGQHAPFVADEQAEQAELGGGQVDLLPSPGDLAGVLVEREVPDPVDRRGRALGARPGTPQERADPCHDLLQRERLGHVVVAPGRQPGHPVLHGVLGREEQDGQLLELRPQAAQHLETVHAGEHDVEDHHVRGVLASGAQCRETVVGARHLPALVAQRGGEQLGEDLLVVDDEDAHGRRSRRGVGLLRVHGSQCASIGAARPAPWPVGDVEPVGGVDQRGAANPHASPGTPPGHEEGAAG
jgi:hypothetical protein